MAATWDRDPALLDSTIEVMVQGGSRVVGNIRVMDVCNDNDCPVPGSPGCCSQNTGNGRYKLIDLEKWPALELLQNFDPNSPTFDINSVVKPQAGNLRPGAPSFVMLLCYRVTSAAGRRR